MLRKLNIFLFSILLLPGLRVFAQSGHYIPMDEFRVAAIERRAMADGVRDHLSVKPWALRDLPEMPMDSASLSTWSNSLVDLWKHPEGRKAKFGIAPILDLSGGYSSQADEQFSVYVGFATFTQFSPKWSLYADLIAGEERPPAYIDGFVDQYGVLPSYGRNRSDTKDASILMPSARLDFAPNEFFQFELGFGRNFIGNGYRSLFLSDVAYNYPYLKMETDFWHIKYVNIFSSLDGSNFEEHVITNFQTKYTTMHYLSWAVSPRFNIGLFESVVWQGRDTLSDRGFDVNYLNPVIFYRPVEYSIGSPDNSLLGMDASFKATSSVLVYGQFLLDEFLLSAFRDGNGWWGNKWAAQLGVKVYALPALPDWFFQAEFNVSRPFTYTHGSVLQNFGHYNQPLAHPLGANFYEGLLRAQYAKGRYYGEGFLMYADYGRDPEGLNLGGDIYRSYVNPGQQFGNTIGQGVGHQLYFQRLEAGLVINQKYGLRAGLNYTFRHLEIKEAKDQTEHLIGIRITTGIYNRYREF